MTKKRSLYQTADFLEGRPRPPGDTQFFFDSEIFTQKQSTRQQILTELFRHCAFLAHDRVKWAPDTLSDEDAANFLFLFTKNLHDMSDINLSFNPVGYLTVRRLIEYLSISAVKLRVPRMIFCDTALQFGDVQTLASQVPDAANIIVPDPVFLSWTPIHAENPTCGMAHNGKTLSMLVSAGHLYPRYVGCARHVEIGVMLDSENISRKSIWKSLCRFFEEPGLVDSLRWTSTSKFAIETMIKTLKKAVKTMPCKIQYLEIDSPSNQYEAIIAKVVPLVRCVVSVVPTAKLSIQKTSLLEDNCRHVTITSPVPYIVLSETSLYEPDAVKIAPGAFRIWLNTPERSPLDMTLLTTRHLLDNLSLNTMMLLFSPISNVQHLSFVNFHLDVSVFSSVFSMLKSDSGVPMTNVRTVDLRNSGVKKEDFQNILFRQFSTMFHFLTDFENACHYEAGLHRPGNETPRSYRLSQFPSTSSFESLHSHFTHGAFQSFDVSYQSTVSDDAIAAFIMHFVCDGRQLPNLDLSSTRAGRATAAALEDYVLSLIRMNVLSPVGAPEIQLSNSHVSVLWLNRMQQTIAYQKYLRLFPTVSPSLKECGTLDSLEIGIGELEAYVNGGGTDVSSLRNDVVPVLTTSSFFHVTDYDRYVTILNSAKEPVRAIRLVGPMEEGIGYQLLAAVSRLTQLELISFVNPQTYIHKLMNVIKDRHHFKQLRHVEFYFPGQHDAETVKALQGQIRSIAGDLTVHVTRSSPLIVPTFRMDALLHYHNYIVMGPAYLNLSSDSCIPPEKIAYMVHRTGHGIQSLNVANRSDINDTFLIMLMRTAVAPLHEVDLSYTAVTMHGVVFARRYATGSSIQKLIFVGVPGLTTLHDTPSQNAIAMVGIGSVVPDEHMVERIQRGWSESLIGGRFVDFIGQSEPTTSSKRPRMSLFEEQPTDESDESSTIEGEGEEPVQDVKRLRRYEQNMVSGNDVLSFFDMLELAEGDLSDITLKISPVYHDEVQVLRKGQLLGFFGVTYLFEAGQLAFRDRDMQSKSTFAIVVKLLMLFLEKIRNLSFVSCNLNKKQLTALIDIMWGVADASIRLERSMGDSMSEMLKQLEGFNEMKTAYGSRSRSLRLMIAEEQELSVEEHLRLGEIGTFRVIFKQLANPVHMAFRFHDESIQSILDQLLVSQYHNTLSTLHIDHPHVWEIFDKFCRAISQSDSQINSLRMVFLEGASFPDFDLYDHPLFPSLQVINCSAMSDKMSSYLQSLSPHGVVISHFAPSDLIFVRNSNFAVALQMPSPNQTWVLQFEDKERLLEINTSNYSLWEAIKRAFYHGFSNIKFLRFADMLFDRAFFQTTIDGIKVDVLFSGVKTVEVLDNAFNDTFSQSDLLAMLHGSQFPDVKRVLAETDKMSAAAVAAIPQEIVIIDPPNAAPFETEIIIDTPPLSDASQVQIGTPIENNTLDWQSLQTIPIADALATYRAMVYPLYGYVDTEKRKKAWDDLELLQSKADVDLFGRYSNLLTEPVNADLQSAIFHFFIDQLRSTMDNNHRWSGKNIAAMLDANVVYRPGMDAYYNDYEEQSKNTIVCITNLNEKPLEINLNIDQYHVLQVPPGHVAFIQNSEQLQMIFMLGKNEPSTLHFHLMKILIHDPSETTTGDNLDSLDIYHSKPLLSYFPVAKKRSAEETAPRPSKKKKTEVVYNHLHVGYSRGDAMQKLNDEFVGDGQKHKGAIRLYGDKRKRLLTVGYLFTKDAVEQFQAFIFHATENDDILEDADFRSKINRSKTVFMTSVVEEDGVLTFRFDVNGLPKEFSISVQLVDDGFFMRSAIEQPRERPPPVAKVDKPAEPIIPDKDYYKQMEKETLEFFGGKKELEKMVAESKKDSSAEITKVGYRFTDYISKGYSSESIIVGVERLADQQRFVMKLFGSLHDYKEEMAVFRAIDAVEELRETTIRLVEGFEVSSPDVTFKTFFGPDQSAQLYAQSKFLSRSAAVASIVMERMDADLRIFERPRSKEGIQFIFDLLTSPDRIAALMDWTRIAEEISIRAEFFHGDIKLDNLFYSLVDGAPRYKMGDFGRSSFTTDISLIRSEWKNIREIIGKVFTDKLKLRDLKIDGEVGTITYTRDDNRLYIVLPDVNSIEYHYMLKDIKLNEENDFHMESAKITLALHVSSNTLRLQVADRDFILPLDAFRNTKVYTYYYKHIQQRDFVLKRDTAEMSLSDINDKLQDWVAILDKRQVLFQMEDAEDPDRLNLLVLFDGQVILRFSNIRRTNYENADVKIVNYTKHLINSMEIFKLKREKVLKIFLLPLHRQFKKDRKGITYENRQEILVRFNVAQTLLKVDFVQQPALRPTVFDIKAFRVFRDRTAMVSGKDVSIGVLDADSKNLGSVFDEVLHVLELVVDDVFVNNNGTNMNLLVHAMTVAPDRSTGQRFRISLHHFDRDTFSKISLPGERDRINADTTLNASERFAALRKAYYKEYELLPLSFAAWPKRRKAAHLLTLTFSDTTVYFRYFDESGTFVPAKFQFIGSVESMVIVLPEPSDGDLDFDLIDISDGNRKYIDRDSALKTVFVPLPSPEEIVPVEKKIEDEEEMELLRENFEAKEIGEEEETEEVDVITTIDVFNPHAMEDVLKGISIQSMNSRHVLLKEVINRQRTSNDSDERKREEQRLDAIRFEYLSEQSLFSEINVLTGGNFETQFQDDNLVMSSNSIIYVLNNLPLLNMGNFSAKGVRSANLLIHAIDFGKIKAGFRETIGQWVFYLQALDLVKRNVRVYEKKIQVLGQKEDVNLSAEVFYLVKILLERQMIEYSVTHAQLYDLLQLGQKINPTFFLDSAIADSVQDFDHFVDFFGSLEDDDRNGAVEDETVSYVNHLNDQSENRFYHELLATVLYYLAELSDMSNDLESETNEDRIALLKDNINRYSALFVPDKDESIDVDLRRYLADNYNEDDFLMTIQSVPIQELIVYKNAHNKQWIYFINCNDVPSVYLGSGNLPGPEPDMPSSFAIDARLKETETKMVDLLTTQDKLAEDYGRFRGALPDDLFTELPYGEFNEFISQHNVALFGASTLPKRLRLVVWVSKGALGATLYIGNVIQIRGISLDSAIQIAAKYDSIQRKNDGYLITGMLLTSTIHQFDTIAISFKAGVPDISLRNEEFRFFVAKHAISPSSTELVLDPVIIAKIVSQQEAQQAIINAENRIQTTHLPAMPTAPLSTEEQTALWQTTIDKNRQRFFNGLSCPIRFVNDGVLIGNLVNLENVARNEAYVQQFNNEMIVLEELLIFTQQVLLRFRLVATNITHVLSIIPSAGFNIHFGNGIENNPLLPNPVSSDLVPMSIAQAAAVMGNVLEKETVVEPVPEPQGTPAIRKQMVNYNQKLGKAFLMDNGGTFRIVTEPFSATNPEHLKLLTEEQRVGADRLAGEIAYAVYTPAKPAETILEINIDGGIPLPIGANGDTPLEGLLLNENVRMLMTYIELEMDIYIYDRDDNHLSWGKHQTATRIEFWSDIDNFSMLADMSILRIFPMLREVAFRNRNAENRLTHMQLGSGLAMLPELRSLIIDGYHIRQMPDDFVGLAPRLTNLALLSKFTWMGQPQMDFAILESLMLGIHFTTTPDSFHCDFSMFGGMLPHLRELSISRVSTKDTPRLLAWLRDAPTHYSMLDLRRLAIHSCPLETLITLPSVTSLQLSNCQISAVPEDFAPPSLTLLDLSNVEESKFRNDFASQEVVLRSNLPIQALFMRNCDLKHIRFAASPLQLTPYFMLRVIDITRNGVGYHRTNFALENNDSRLLPMLRTLLIDGDRLPLVVFKLFLTTYTGGYYIDRGAERIRSDVLNIEEDERTSPVGFLGNRPALMKRIQDRNRFTSLIIYDLGDEENLRHWDAPSEFNEPRFANDKHLRENIEMAMKHPSFMTMRRVEPYFRIWIPTGDAQLSSKECPICYNEEGSLQEYNPALHPNINFRTNTFMDYTRDHPSMNFQAQGTKRQRIETAPADLTAPDGGKIAVCCNINESDLLQDYNLKYNEPISNIVIPEDKKSEFLRRIAEHNNHPFHLICFQEHIRSIYRNSEQLYRCPLTQDIFYRSYAEAVQHNHREMLNRDAKKVHQRR